MCSTSAGQEVTVLHTNTYTTQGLTDGWHGCATHTNCGKEPPDHQQVNIHLRTSVWLVVRVV
jgi:hypothetical protein